MADSRLPVRYQGPSAVQRTRERLAWVSDDDLPLLQDRQSGLAGLLSLVTGGGGQLYVGDHRKGLGLTAAAAGSFLAAVSLTSVAWAPFLAIGAISAIDAWRKARAINRHLAARRAEHVQAGPHPAAYRLLAAMSAADPAAARDAAAAGMAPPAPAAPAAAAAPATAAAPSPHRELLERLHKLATIRAAGAMAEHEHRARKIDLLSRACDGLDRDALDDLLYELLPLRDSGVIADEDIQLVKDLGGL